MENTDIVCTSNFPPVLQAVIGDRGNDLVAGREEIRVREAGEVGQRVLEPHHVRVAHEQLVAEGQERVDEQHLLPAHLVEGGRAPDGVLGGHPAAHVEDGDAPEVELPEQLGVHGADEEAVDAEVREVAHPGKDEVEEGVVAKGDDDGAAAGAGAHHLAGEAERARRGHPLPPRRGLPDGPIVHGLRLRHTGDCAREVGGGGGRGRDGERGRGERGEGGEEEEERGDGEPADDGAVDPDEDRLGRVGGAPRRHLAGRRRRIVVAGEARSAAHRCHCRERGLGEVGFETRRVWAAPAGRGAHLAVAAR